MSLTRKQSAVLHIKLRELGIENEAYRQALFEIAGVQSSKDLDSAGFRLVMDRLRAFERRASATVSTRAAIDGLRHDTGYRYGMGSPAQLDLIRSLWAEWTDTPQADELRKWLERTFKVSALRFLSAEQASQAIGALRTMVARSRSH